jgi:hypothetical protein
MSSAGPNTQAAKRLLADVIDSFEKLEIVVQVHKAGFAIPPTSVLASALSVPVDEIERCIKVLRDREVLTPAGPWRAAVDALVQMYDEDRIEVLNLMTRTALERVRKEAARVFADAFVLRPKKKGDSDA